MMKKLVVTSMASLAAMSLSTVVSAKDLSRSMGSADARRNVVLDAQVDGVRVLPPVRLYPNGRMGFDTWPGKLAGATETRRDDNLFNVVDPAFQAFLPPADRNSRTAVVIAPGGGFRQLSIESEGNDVARWLAARGIAAFVLKYRTVQQKGPDYSMMARWGEFNFDTAGAPAVADGTEAIRRIRAGAATYGIDPQRIVFIGFSAGAHVAGYQALNAVVADRPNYAALIYGAPFDNLPAIPDRFVPGTIKPGQNLGPVKMPDTGTPSPNAVPPIFIAGSQNDPLAGEKTRRFYDALVGAGYSPEGHFYLNGGHGYGLNETHSDSRHFVENFYWWLETQGLTRKPGDPDLKEGAPSHP